MNINFWVISWKVQNTHQNRNVCLLCTFNRNWQQRFPRSGWWHLMIILSRLSRSINPSPTFYHLPKSPLTYNRCWIEVSEGRNFYLFLRLFKNHRHTSRQQYHFTTVHWCGWFTSAAFHSIHSSCTNPKQFCSPFACVWRHNWNGVGCWLVLNQLASFS